MNFNINLSKAKRKSHDFKFETGREREIRLLWDVLTANKRGGAVPLQLCSDPGEQMSEFPARLCKFQHEINNLRTKKGFNKPEKNWVWTVTYL